MLFSSSRKIVLTTAVDFPTAQIANSAGVDAILVGDSLAMTTLGFSNTRQATVAQMLHHTVAVLRGAGKTPVIADLPFQSYATPKAALATARKFLQLGVHAVKLEGGTKLAPIVHALTQHKISVCGHIGLTPQTMRRFRVRGRTPQEARQIFNDALVLEKSGGAAIVLECLPWPLAKKITDALKIPTIGIGAGQFCDGQILVFHDLIGWSEKNFQPKFLKRYANIRGVMLEAVKHFIADVKNKKFPGKKYWYE